MKKTVILLIIILFVYYANSQTVTIAGYRFTKSIKGPKHKRSKVLELMQGNNGNYMVASYAGPKSLITVIVYNLYTWEKVGEYVFKGRAELYNSYFDDMGDYFYVNNDIFKNQYKKINIKTHKVENVDCSETPKGCNKIEPEIYKTEFYTVGENYYIKRVDDRKNYIKIYKKKGLFIESFDDEEFDYDYDDNVNDSISTPGINTDTIIEQPNNN
ncbi:MAG: hypothetical protein KAT68_05990 [Bacteroidales bacterium]|nr:hypothetical protein [Bacteroidales bacterium]